MGQLLKMFSDKTLFSGILISLRMKNKINASNYNSCSGDGRDISVSINSAHAANSASNADNSYIL
jgi:hypothetical protein